MKWISVKDRLPEPKQLRSFNADYTKEILCVDNNQIQTAYFLYNARDNSFSWRGTNIETLDNVTHWMELPELPKE